MDRSDDEGLDIFQEPESFRLPEKEATFETHKLLSGEELRLRLVGHNPLWGHMLWNAGRTISKFIETSASELVHGKNVLELGAGAGLPSIVSALNGAETVVVTDYPDADLVDNLRYNIEHSVPTGLSSKIFAEVGCPSIGATGGSTSLVVD
jgi:nicotinamide N-methyltransferase